jgi:bifunctional ADP-heptose synthase (sugar kinase/adenylyltransferase)
MTRDRFLAIASRYPAISIAVFGDFCLDRYLEIDPARREVSIETGLPVHCVTNVRAQPGGAGTILNNLAALGIGKLYPVGFVGEDGEGYELRRALQRLPGVELEYLEQTSARRTHTYCKPLLMSADRAPEELNRLDFNNYTPTPAPLEAILARRLATVAAVADAIIVLDQVELAGTGAVTAAVVGALKELIQDHPDLPVLADSRHGLGAFPSAIFKMNAAELAALNWPGGDAGAPRALPPEGSVPSAYGTPASAGVQCGNLDGIRNAAVALARRNGKPVFITLAERGILAAEPSGRIEHSPALDLRGPIDIVGAGDAVTANLAAALAAEASVREAVEAANAAASVVIHKLGTTGTANVAEIAGLLPEGK